MKSLTARILISLACCLACCLVVLVYWSDLEFRKYGPLEFYQHTLRYYADKAEKLWLNHEIKHLESYFQELNEQYDSEFQLLDIYGKDIIGFDDHPDLVDFVNRDHDASRPPRKDSDKLHRPFRASDGMLAFVNQSTSGDFYLVQWVMLPPYRFPLFPFVSIAFILGFFGWMMNHYVAKPVGSLSRILEKFGQGNLSARIQLDRNDEIGDLAQSFNQMADQVASLVERERGVVRSVAHEVRGPLTRMILLIERLRQNKQVQESLDRLETEIKTLSKMPDILLHLSMVENGQASIVKRPVEMDEYLQSFILKMSPQSQLKNCPLNFQRDDSISLEWQMETDPEILSRCLENIVSNAVRFAPEGTGIDLTLEKNGDDFIIKIRDQGPGVIENEISSIFRPFFRSDSSRNRHTGGLGLGLAITRSGVEALGGNVWAENANPGLRVTIKLPEIGL